MIYSWATPDGRSVGQRFDAQAAKMIAGASQPSLRLAAVLPAVPKRQFKEARNE